MTLKHASILLNVSTTSLFWSVQPRAVVLRDRLKFPTLGLANTPIFQRHFCPLQKPSMFQESWPCEPSWMTKSS